MISAFCQTLRLCASYGRHDNCCFISPVNIHRLFFLTDPECIPCGTEPEQLYEYSTYLRRRLKPCNVSVGKSPACHLVDPC